MMNIIVIHYIIKVIYYFIYNINYFIIILFKGALYLQLENYHKAIDIFEKLLLLDPYNEMSQLNLISSYFNVNNYPKSLYYNKLLYNNKYAKDSVKIIGLLNIIQLFRSNNMHVEALMLCKMVHIFLNLLNAVYLLMNKGISIIAR